MVVNAAGQVVSYTPLDYKTKGSEPIYDDAKLFYEHQLDLYSLLLEKNGMPCNGVGYLIFYYPIDVDTTGNVIFGRKVIELKTSVRRAEELCREAAECVASKIPSASPKCEYCHHHEGLVKYSSGKLLKPTQMELPFQNQ